MLMAAEGERLHPSTYSSSSSAGPDARDHDRTHSCARCLLPLLPIDAGLVLRLPNGAHWAPPVGRPWAG